VTALGVEVPPLRYDCDRNRLAPFLRDRFVELAEDDETRAFLARVQQPHGRVITATRSLLASFVSDYDANALLGAYPMHVLSTAQWETLLGGRPGGRLLDIGAGNGEVTAAAAPCFDEVATTETSAGMARRLRARGFASHEVDLSTAAPAGLGRFDVVSLLNVLDRCARPLSLLDRARTLLAPMGRLVVAVPLPLECHVHVAGHTVDPEELLPPAVGAWEDAVSLLVERVFVAAGMDVLALTRVPYLCRGDTRAPLYVLDDAVIVAR
jgi:SAM-dependent methyltransferase